MLSARAISSLYPLPKHVDTRKHVGIHAERVSDVSNTDYPGYNGDPDEDASWDFEKFKKNLVVEVTTLSNRSVEFDLKGVDASIANAFRRILIAEVPTVAVENVFVWMNSSIIVDEVLSHRIGLVPLQIEPTLAEMKLSPNDQATDRNTFVFRLQIECKRIQPAPSGSKQKGKISSNEPELATSRSTNPKPKLYENDIVLSSHLKWEPQGEQARVFKDNPPRPCNGNIVLAKLRPGQEIDMELHAVKGVGKDHAKFSPVATASYRLHPLIALEKPIPPHLAQKFAKCFSPGVIDIDPVTQQVSVNELNTRRDTVSREVLRHKEFEGCVKLGRIRDWFLFKIESESAYPPERLLPEAISVMRSKIRTLKQAAEALMQGDSVPSIGVALAGGTENADIEMSVT